MAEIRLKGIPTGEDIGLVSATVGGASGSAIIGAFQQPSAVTGVPRITGNAYAQSSLSVDTTGLSNITAYLWRIIGGATLATTATFTSTMMQGGLDIEVVVTADGVDYTSPGWHIYAHMMDGTDHSAMMADDQAVLNIVPHHTATHIAVADGPWTDPATWLNGKIPRNGAMAHIPLGRAVTYDNDRFYRLDSLRIDGALTWSRAKSTRLLAEHIIVTRSGALTIGTSANRLPAQYRADITISGRAYGQGGYFDTDMDLSRDSKLWGRGLVVQGVGRIWGAQKLSHAKAVWPAIWTGSAFQYDELIAGATSLTLSADPTGWEVGDEIVITGTRVSYPGEGFPLTLQDEVRRITGISGRVISWAEPLIYDHTNQLADSTRKDLYPLVFLRDGRNVCICSESTAVTHRRGHVAFMGAHCTMDIWDAAFNALGRTRKADNDPAGVIDETGDFRYFDAAGDTARVVPLTAQSNIQGRYSIHAHHAGFAHAGARPVAHGCYVEGTPGWGIVHHACDMDIQNCGVYKFAGAGMVAESGNEVGSWVGCFAAGATVTEGDIRTQPKTFEGQQGLVGDMFRQGIGFAFRGRAVRSNRNIAVGCSYGHTFYHRTVSSSDSRRIVLPIDPRRAHLDLSEMGMMGNAYGNTNAAFFDRTDYPIIHMADNESQACLGGLFVTKSGPLQNHDASVKFKRFRSWGFNLSGVTAEYVATYIFEDFDIVAGPEGASTGIGWGGNAFQMFDIRAQIEGVNNAVVRAAGDTADASDNFDGASDPRWGSVGRININCTSPVRYETMDGIKTGPEIAYDDPDLDGTAIDYDAIPTENFPLYLGQWDGNNGNGNPGTLISWPTNADGTKSDNLSNAGIIAPHAVGDSVFTTSSGVLRNLNTSVGYHSFEGKTVIKQKDIISDRLTGRYHKFSKLWENTDPTPLGSNKGPLVHTTTPISGPASIQVPIAQNGSVTFSVLNNLTGGSGTYVLDGGDKVSPDHGVISLHTGTGEITLTPDRGFTGTDEALVFVESDGQYHGIRIDMLVGPGGTVVAPAAGVHVTAFDHADTGTIGVQLGTPPPTGGRRILMVSYSTDDGTTWRRLSNGWRQAIYKITTGSNGIALVTGNYTVRIRFSTDYDFTLSAASGGTPVTVS